MKLQHSLVIFFIITLVFVGVPTSAVTAQNPHQNGLRVLSSQPNKLVVELTVGEFEIETINQEGQTYQRFRIPDMSQTMNAGQPQLPIRGSWLGVPTTKNLTMRVIDSEVEPLSQSYQLYPAPKVNVTGNGEARQATELFDVDEAHYQSDKFYPSQPAELEQTAYIRQQAVAQLLFYPVRYNPTTGETQLYRRIVVELSWPSHGRAAQTKADSAAYEALYADTLLNYDTLNRTVAQPTSASKLSRQAVSTNTVKINVNQNGIYQVSYDDLANAGLPLDNVKPTDIQMSHQGNPIAIDLRLANSAAFASGDSILFYGTAIDSIYTTENVYILKVGQGAGQQMTTRSGSLNLQQTLATSFTTMLHREEDAADGSSDAYYQQMPNPQDGEDHWFWGARIATSDGKTVDQVYTATLKNFANSGQVTVRAQLKGRNISNHRTRLLLNGTEIDDQTWAGFEVFTHEVTIDANQLVAGENKLIVRSGGLTQASQIYFNWFEIDYPDMYVAENNALPFGAPSAGQFRFEITEFSSNEIYLYDISTTNAPIRILDSQIAANGTQFNLQFSDNASANSRYYAVATNQFKSPLSITALSNQTNLRSSDNSADHIIITHPDFMDAAMNLRDHRRGKGLRAEVVNVDDIYNQFSGGIFTPQAIQDFLKFTLENWQKPAPSYVVLLGDGDWDYRNLLTKRPTYVPSQMVEQQDGQDKGQAPSDNWFVELTGNDILPDMMIGRLPASTAAEATNLVNKVINYKSDPSWQKNVLLIADDGLRETFEPVFEQVSKDMAAELPFYYETKNVFVERLKPNGNPTNESVTALNQGALLVNYAGHGEADSWGRWRDSDNNNRSIVGLNDVEGLSNSDRLPIVTVANCLSGFFMLPSGSRSMAEQFILTENKGAVGVWAPTWLDYPSGHRVLMTNFYQAIFQNDLYQLGKATDAAKLALLENQPFFKGLVQTFVLFGDPATSLDLAPNYPYLERTGPPDGGTSFGPGAPAALYFNKPIMTSSVVISTGNYGIEYSYFGREGDAEVYNPNKPFPLGATITLTVTGQDLHGNPIGTGLVPNPWTFSIPSLNPVKSVQIVGSSEGTIINPTSAKGNYNFNVTISPTTATRPLTYSWQATDQAPIVLTNIFGDGDVNYRWDRPGLKTIAVTASNRSGVATDTFKFRILGSSTPIDANTAISLTYRMSDTVVAGINGPAGAVNRDLELDYAPLEIPATSLSNLDTFAERAFLLSPVENGQVITKSFTFEKPISITLHYADKDVSDESSLVLKYVDDNGTWKDAAESCNPTSSYQRDSAANTITVAICHLSEFALVQPNLQKSYLPVVIKQ